jgi:hypothetical protein
VARRGKMSTVGTVASVRGAGQRETKVTHGPKIVRNVQSVARCGEMSTVGTVANVRGAGERETKVTPGPGIVRSAQRAALNTYGPSHKRSSAKLRLQ